MRKINFRVWDNLKKSWSNYKSYDNILYFMDKNTGVWFTEHHKRYNDFIISEYTGMKDINGKEIYEGDILSDGNNTEHYRVIFENGGFKAECKDYSLDLLDVAHYSKVIGNIFENSELLGG